MASFSHEGIGFGRDGSLWEGDENHAGALYKAVPRDPSDLRAGGQLLALKDGVGFFAVDPVTAISDAFNGGATLFDRPEDIDQRDGRIYVAVTEPPDDAAASSTPGHPVLPGGVYMINDSSTPHVVQFVAVNDPATGALGEQVPGLQFPDNLAFDRKGNLYIHEDIPDDTKATPTNVHSKQYRNMQDELWVAVPDRNGDGTSAALYKFANMGNSATATPCQNEWTGGIFLDGKTLFVNQQHATTRRGRSRCNAATTCTGPTPSSSGSTRVPRGNAEPGQPLARPALTRRASPGDHDRVTARSPSCLVHDASGP